jgi:hypothetical protein
VSGLLGDARSRTAFLCLGLVPDDATVGDPLGTALAASPLRASRLRHTESTPRNPLGERQSLDDRVTSACTGALLLEYERSAPMATRPPLQTKQCTFPNCDGRMVLTSVENRDPVIEPLRGQPPAPQHWYWQCDRDQTHTESKRD